MLHSLLALAICAAGDPSSADVERVVAKAVGYLISSQWIDGAWTPTDASHYATGQAALSLYALSKAGLPSDHPTMRAALRFLKDRPLTHVYSVCCMTLAFTAIDAKAYHSEIEACAEFLVRAQTDSGGWHYTEHGTPPGDLSNTLYALLGLHTAALAQVAVDPAVFERACQQVHRWQAADGGFSYNSDPAVRPTGSITAGGLASLKICQEALSREVRKAEFIARIPSWIDDGLEWFGEHFRGDRNPQPHNPDADKQDDRWKYYYLYGVERVGSLLQESKFGEHDWYSEGAQFLVKAQRANGSFGSAETDEDVANTCFAILFLKRATARTVRLADLEEKLTSEVLLRVDGLNPMNMMLQRFSPQLLKRCSWPPGGIANLHIQSVEYFVDKVSVGRVEGDGAVPIMTKRFGHQVTLEDGGQKEFCATVVFVLPDRQTEMVESNKVSRFILPQVPAHVLRFLEEAPQNALRPELVRHLAASSYFGAGFEPVNAVDGLYTNCWLSKEDDPQPWIRFEIAGEGVVANCVRLQRATRGALDPDQYASPQEVWITLNEKTRLKRTLTAAETETEVIEFPRARITALEIKIMSRLPGRSHQGAVGFQEIALENSNRTTKKSK